VLLLSCAAAAVPDAVPCWPQVEADIRPFRGLLIGLFFLSVGGSINMTVLKDNYDVILWMLAGLVSLKAGVNMALGPLFGLTR
jgi:Kef-type K+ transport system membrane component KefB